MIRKTILGLVAASAIAALAPTAASAHYYGGYGYRSYAPSYSYGYSYNYYPSYSYGYRSYYGGY